MQRAIASEGEGTLAEAVDGVRLLAVGEQCLAGEGYVLADVADGDVEHLSEQLKQSNVKHRILIPASDDISAGC